MTEFPRDRVRGPVRSERLSLVIDVERIHVGTMPDEETRNFGTCSQQEMHHVAIARCDGFS